MWPYIAYALFLISHQNSTVLNTHALFSSKKSTLGSSLLLDTPDTQLLILPSTSKVVEVAFASTALVNPSLLHPHKYIYGHALRRYRALLRSFIRVGVEQWFLTFLEVLSPTCPIHALIEPFVIGKMKSALFFKFKSHAYNCCRTSCTMHHLHTKSSCSKNKTNIAWFTHQVFVSI